MGCRPRPVPFIDDKRSKPRPVAVFSARDFNRSHGLVVGGMITTAAAGRWPTDHEIVDLPAAGLKKPCVVRFKIISLPVGIVGRRIGSFAMEGRARLDLLLGEIVPRAPRSD